MPGKRARPVRREAARKRTRTLRAPRRAAHPVVAEWPSHAGSMRPPRPRSGAARPRHCGGLAAAARLPRARSRRGTGVAVGRRERDELADRPPGGSPSHGLLAVKAAEIAALVHDWGEIDRSHRKLAHRGSYLGRVWVSPATVRRVLAGQGLRLKPPPRPGRSLRRPFPEWIDYRGNQIWIYDTTPFHARGDGGDRGRGPGVTQVAGAHRLGRGDLHTDRDHVPHRHSRSRGCWPASRPARTGWHPSTFSTVRVPGLGVTARWVAEAQACSTGPDACGEPRRTAVDRHVESSGAREDHRAILEERSAQTTSRGGTRWRSTRWT